MRARRTEDDGRDRTKTGKLKGKHGGKRKTLGSGTVSKKNPARKRKGGAEVRLPWRSMETRYVSDETTTFESIADEFDCHPSTVSNRAKVDDWVTKRREFIEERARELRERAKAEIVGLAAEGVASLLVRTRSMRERFLDLIEAELPTDGKMVVIEESIAETVDIPAQIDEETGQATPPKKVTRTVRRAKVDREILKGAERALATEERLLQGIMRLTDGNSGRSGDGGSSIIEESMDERLRKFQAFQFKANQLAITGSSESPDESQDGS